VVDCSNSNATIFVNLTASTIGPGHSMWVACWKVGQVHGHSIGPVNAKQCRREGERGCSIGCQKEGRYENKEEEEHPYLIQGRRVHLCDIRRVRVVLLWTGGCPRLAICCFDFFLKIAKVGIVLKRRKG
jgi:hypothetical protein